MTRRSLRALLPFHRGSVRFRLVPLSVLMLHVRIHGEGFPSHGRMGVDAGTCTQCSKEPVYEHLCLYLSVLTAILAQGQHVYNFFFMEV